MHRLYRGAISYRTVHEVTIRSLCDASRTRCHPARLFRTLAGLRKKNPNDDEDLVVHWFEQDERGTRKVNEQEEEEAEESLRQTITETQKELDDLVARYPEYAKQAEQDEDNTGPLGKLLTDDIPDDYAEDMDPEDLRVNFRLPPILELRLKAFNHALVSAAPRLSDPRIVRHLWINYLRCASAVPGFRKEVPDLAWEVLWRGLSQERLSDNPKRMAKLLEDMIRAGKTLTPVQQITRIRAHLAMDETPRALKLWYEQRNQLLNHAETKEPFEELGVFLEAKTGHPEQAQNLAFEILYDQPKGVASRARILIPVIGAWVRKGDERSIKNAWLVYLYIRKVLGLNIKLDDYDTIFMTFFESGQKGIALAVFKDLVLAGRSSPDDSTNLFMISMDSLERLRSGTTNQEDLNAVSLHALAYLPGHLQNKFFFGSWIKRLLGLGQIDAAASLLELMHERGIQPDPKHINGIIGAWFRDGDASDQKLAVQMGWAMVQERFEFVDRRRQNEEKKFTKIKPVFNEYGIATPAHYSGRRLPPATLKTFCLLMMYYERNNMTTYVQHLHHALNTAELQPNTYFMNQLMYSRFRQGGATAAWSLFLEMKDQLPARRPDLDSFACLWDACKSMVSKYTQMDKFPTPRRLFSHMGDWISRMDPDERAEVANEFTRKLYIQIITCFCRWQDVKGTIISLYAMRDVFCQYPDQEVVRQVALQVAQFKDRRAAPHRPGRQRVARRKIQLHTALNVEQNTGYVLRVLEKLVQLRKEELEAEGISRDNLSPKEKSEESLYVLVELLKATERLATNSYGRVEDLDEDLEKVAFDMGAGPFQMGKPVYKHKQDLLDVGET